MYAPREHPRDGRGRAAPQSVERELGAVAASLGAAIHSERTKRALTLRALAAMADVSSATIQGIEVGRVASLESYLRLGRALDLKPAFELLGRRAAVSRQRDVVHAAMGEFEARHFTGLGLEMRLDEPYQHYQFAGRGDFVAWSREWRALLHIENKTAIPDVQEVLGTFSAKRSYMGSVMAERADLVRWRSETHVIAALWSTEILAVIRKHRASFETVGAAGHAIESWWSGNPPAPGVHSAVVLLDPVPRRSLAKAWVHPNEALASRARYANYAAAAEAIDRSASPGQPRQ